jgi:hypothetical protein
LAEAHQSRSRIFTAIILLIVAIGAFIILRPRLWVKNKTAKVIVDGRLSEDVKLFHGSRDRLLFYLKSDPGGAYVYDSEAGAWRCDASYFTSLKIIALSTRHDVSGCAEAENGDVLGNPHRELQSFSFEGHDWQYNDHHYVVSWQAAPR